MIRGRIRLLALAVLAFALLWHPFIRPAARGAVAVSSIYGQVLLGTDPIAAVMPVPRTFETRERLAGESVRMSWWRPGWGERHPGVLLVNGATPRGNDDPETGRLAATLALSGYLVALPELPFLTAGRFEEGAPAQVAAAYAVLRARPETDGEHTGAFGFSVGGGVLLAAAGTEIGLRDAAYVAVLGAYFDVRTYLASVVSGQQLRGGAVVSWVPSDEARSRLPEAARAAARAGVERAALEDALGAGTYDEALRRLRALPARLGAAYDALSPSAAWRSVRPPVFWLHDAEDHFEPIAEAEAARAATREGRTTVTETRIVSHAAPLGAPAGGVSLLAGELWNVLGFAVAVLREAG